MAGEQNFYLFIVMKTISIYTLIDPITNEVRYVGKTTNLSKRLNRHINESKKSTTSHKKAWIKGLLKNGLKPKLEVIDEILENDDWKFWEIYWIEQLRAWGFKLTNETEGGDGVDKGSIPWNKGMIGVMKPNKTTFRKGNKIGEETRIKKGQRLSPKTEFKEGAIPHNKTKLQQFDLDGNLLREFESFYDAAKHIGVGQSALSQCFIRKTYRCKGYIWKKVEK